MGAAVGLGCEPRSLDGWLELLCRKKNGTGGHPLRAVVHGSNAALIARASGAERPPTTAADGEGADEPAPGDAEVPAGERGELRLVLPFQDGSKSDATLEWTDTRYELSLDGTQATFTWAGSAIPHRRACQAMLDENQRALAEAQEGEAPERVMPAETRRLPKFGVCQPAGLGSWALSLARLGGKGEGAARSLVFELAVTRVDLDGHRTTAPFGNVEVAPGGLEVGPLRAYDYDDDGRDELIVPYEIRALAPDAPAPAPSALWSFDGSAITPYEKAPAVGGGVSVEQLDFDMRPDLGTYGPFVTWLPAECGLKTCVPRLTGPKFFWHSAPDGGFSAHDAAARTAVQRACGKAPHDVVATTSNGVNLQKTAENLVCARVRGGSTTELRAELEAKRPDLCGSETACPVLGTLEAWLTLPLPVELAAAP